MKKLKKSEDKISGLPDTVLVHILSYLTTEQSVRTGILSKRWLSVWSNVPVLILDDSLLSYPDPYKKQAILSSFIQFLDRVFNLYNASDSLQKLALSCSKFDCYRVNEWMMSALNFGVKELDICITENKYFNLRAPLFAHQDLVSLSLGKKIVLDIQGEVLLPCLKKLHLDSIEFSDDESCVKLLSGCPVLEHVHLEKCGMRSVKTLQISKLPMFNYLTKLELGDHSSCRKLLPMFLASSPFLKDLVLCLQSEVYGSFDFEWHNPIQVPQCLLDSLKSVLILGFNGQSDMLKFIKYLVANAKVLGELSAAKEEGDEELTVSKELLKILLEKQSLSNKPLIFHSTLY